MKRNIITLIILLGFSIVLLGQDFDDLLKEVEKNNTTLKALRYRADAQKLSNKTGIFMQNPEAGFNYLWGNPSALGNRTDLSLIQSFDFPTTYMFQHQVSDMKNEQVELEYLKQKKDLILKTKMLLYELTYVNAMERELDERLSHARSIAESVSLKLQQGEVSRIELNKAQLNQLNMARELDLLMVEKEGLLSELTNLNGGIETGYTGTSYLPTVIPADFDTWYAEAEKNNPALNWVKQEVEISSKMEKLELAKSLPKIQAGYMSEKVIGEQFQGITVGLSIPLWENKNSIKYAKANSAAMRSIASDQKIRFYNHLKKLHARAVALQENHHEYRSSLEEYNNTDLLKKAIEEGEISLIDYLLELSIYYESIDSALEMERDMNRALGELMQYE